MDCHVKEKKWGATVYPNLALCKIAAWHKAQGDEVEWATMFEHYDIVYKSKIFNFSPDDLYAYNADKIIKGGTGYDIASKLPDEIDRTYPDYSIYPSIPDDVAYGFLTRGCPNKCKWCVVPRKEGSIRPYMDVDEIATETRRKLVLMDNNILAAGDYCLEQFEKIIKRGYAVDFNQALDARLVTPQHAKLLAKMKWKENRIRFGCDTFSQIQDCENAMDFINMNGYKGEYFLYTMIQGNLRADYRRIHYWWKKLQEGRRHLIPGRPIYAYAQPYRDPDKKNIVPQWEKDMAQWCNKRQIFTQCDFKDFEPRKGFKCIEYFL